MSRNFERLALYGREPPNAFDSVSNIEQISIPEVCTIRRECGFTTGIITFAFNHCYCRGRSEFMAKRRGNPNWGKPDPIGPVIPTITEFQRVTREFKLQPEQYVRSTRLREWARHNKNSKFIPEALLEAWGFEVEKTL
jgi:hypothetical protein